MASAFSTPIDYFDMDRSPLKLKSSTENKTSQYKDAQGPRGDNVARDVYGTRSAPSCDFEVIADGDITLVLGDVNTVDSVVYMLTGGSITTKFNTPPGVTLSGMSLQAGATANATVSPGAIAISALHKAQILGDAFTLTGTGCELNECSMDIITRPSVATVKGDPVAHDIAGDKLLVKVVIVQTDSTKPTLTPAEGWEVVSELTCANPDEDYPKWTAELAKDIESAEPEA